MANVKKAFSLGSYFMLPQQGMSKYEVLSRGSLFLVKSKKARRKAFHLISAAHIPYPFEFPRLYPTAQANYQWLQFVTRADTLLQLQIRDELNGTVRHEFPLDFRTYPKSGTDLIVMHLDDEADFVNSAKERFGIDVEPLSLAGEVTMNGYDLIDNKEDPTEAFMMPLIMKADIGHFLGSKLLLKTERPSSMGICGGPVILQDGGKGEVIGMVEALVTPNLQGVEPNTPRFHALKQIENNTMIISATEISAFIDEVESEMDDL